MARKLNKNLVALGSAAILTVYSVGFLRTNSSAVELANSPAVAVATATTLSSTSAVTAVVPATLSQSVAGTTNAETTSAQVTTSYAAYKDGTYTGAGSNRFGEVDVAVTVQNGSITAVNITKSTTHYPVGRIAGLPGEVVSRQSANIDYVSGATYSSMAFKDAVTRALSQAASPAASTQG